LCDENGAKFKRLDPELANRNKQEDKDLRENFLQC
jgi:hypothetical protein